MTANESGSAAIDQVIARARAVARETAASGLAAPPNLKVAVVACMDARLDVAAVLGFEPGDAHVIRNAGGVVTEDVIRSLVISQRLLGTQEVMIIQHTGCGMATFTDDAFRHAIERDTGIRPAWNARAFADLDESVRRGIGLVATSPFLPHRDAVRGFVWDVATGDLREVAPAEVRVTA